MEGGGQRERERAHYGSYLGPRERNSERHPAIDHIKDLEGGIERERPYYS